MTRSGERDGTKTGPRPLHRFVEHGGEVEVELTAESEAGIFAAALDAFAELVVDDDTGPAELRTVELRGRERSLLLVDWLGELLYLGEVERFVPTEAVSIELADDWLRATVAGRHNTLRPLVKGIALHGLEFEPRGGAWHGRVIFDV
jgi:SHS2 domain-containing protein